MKTLSFGKYFLEKMCLSIEKKQIVYWINEFTATATTFSFHNALQFNLLFVRKTFPNN